MKIKIFPTLLAAFFIIIFFVFYKGLQNSNIYTPNVNIEKNIPSFKAKMFLTNKKIRSEDIFNSNQFYLLNIWSSWCIPCRDEHPFLMNLSAQKNIKIIGLNYKDNNEKAKIFLNEFSNPYDKILLDENGTLAIEWGAYGVPESFLIYNKKIIKKIIGPLDENLLYEIEKMIK
tara:strand:+ start:534 stop:1052 length:519 start_codon:yes stop_codon:yes gene_type:complete